MQRKPPGVKREFVFEENNERNLMALARNGNVEDLLSYLNQMNLEKVNAFFIDSVLTEQFLGQFPSDYLREAFFSAVLESEVLRSLVSVFTTLSFALPKGFRMPGTPGSKVGLFGFQPIQTGHADEFGFPRGFSYGK